jgi:hypothetical protein
MSGGLFALPQANKPPRQNMLIVVLVANRLQTFLSGV